MSRDQEGVGPKNNTASATNGDEARTGVAGAVFRGILGDGTVPVELATVYSQYGYALAALQHFELAVSAIVQHLSNKPVDQAWMDDILSGRDKRMIGQLVRELRRRGGDFAVAAESLRPLVQARNRLVHRAFLEPKVAAKLGTVDGRSALIEEFRAVAENAEGFARIVGLGALLVMAFKSFGGKRRARSQ